MKILKGTKLKINHNRKGTFLAIAANDFDTDDEWYDVILNQDFLVGYNTDWIRGDSVPARKGMSEIIILE